MTTKTDTEQLRTEFEAWVRRDMPRLPLRKVDSFVGYVNKETQTAFLAYQAGRAALQSQKPKGNDIMLSGVIRMPFEMAMADPISRMQFYQRAQQALNELEALQHSCKETSHNREDENTEVDAIVEAVRKQFCALPRYSFVMRKGGVSRVHDSTGNWIEFDQAHALFDPISVDHARRVEGGKQ